MITSRPQLIWVNSKEVQGERSYWNPELDRLLHVPGNEGYHLLRGILCIRGNILRGRPANQDTLNIWYIDDGLKPIVNLAANQSIHGTVPTLIGDCWGGEDIGWTDGGRPESRT